MAFPRLTVFWKDYKGQGGTETIYCSSTVADLTTAQTNAFAYLKLRANLVQIGFHFIYARVSMDDVAGDRLLVDLPAENALYGYNPDFPPSTGFEDFSYNTYLINMSSGSLYRKNFYMSGIPDALSDVSYQFMLGGGPLGVAWQRAYIRWQDELVSGRWAIKSLSKDPTISPIKPVSGFISATGSVSSLAHGLAPLDTIRISKCHFSALTNANINGTWKVASVTDANSFILQGWDNTKSFFLTNVGQLRKQVYVLQTINNVLARGFTEHKRGRPFGLLSGRRSVRKGGFPRHVV